MILPAPRLTVVIVAYDSRQDLERTLPALTEQLRADDELIVVDNGDDDRLPSLLAALTPGARLLRPGGNIGFGAACNLAAEAAHGELFVTLNPDAVPLSGWRDGIERPWTLAYGWEMWMGLVACEGGRTVNSMGNPVHFTGLAWAGGFGVPVPAALSPREVASASGACLGMPLERFRAYGGFTPELFLYHEDVDLSVRVWAAGGKVGLEPSAVVDHAYEFTRNPGKLRLLERNRLLLLVRTYPVGLLALLLPALAVLEIALLVAATAGGWGRQKLLADVDAVRLLPWALRTRRALSTARRISASQFAEHLSWEPASPVFGAPAALRAVRLSLRLYWHTVLLLLRLFRRGLDKIAL